MNSEPNEKPPASLQLDSLKEAAQNATAATRDAAQQASDATREMCHTMSVRAEDTMKHAKEYARQNPVPVILGAIAFGAALGYMLVLARREEPTFRERFAAEPVEATRAAILAALAPLSNRLHEGYDTARNGAEKAMDKLHRYQPARTVDSWSDQLGRVGSNLKFW